jgi:phosphoglycerol transferase MdoB-like AlkP superfamily enzyme
MILAMVKEKLIDSLRYFTSMSLLFIVVFMALRVYEYFFIRSRAEVAPSVVFSGWPYDLLFLLSVCCAVGVLFVLLRFLQPKLALVFCAGFFVLMMLMNMALVEYFQTTLIPLSADLYGYTLRDIQLTAGASARLTVFQLVRFLLFPALFIAGVYWLNRKRMDQKVPTAAAIIFGTVTLLSWFLPHRPPAENYEHDLDRYVAVNKTEYFLSNSFRYFVRKEPARALDPAVYPFLHDVKYTDAIGSYLNVSPGPPNIVFIIVEGLGRDFTGPDAEYGGFTPFLDSLAQKSLSWHNALSNAGRTFGVLPSMLGSLPYGESSILHYGQEMPGHQTLISLLKPYGYTASFFYGGHPGFDNIDIFMERQGTDFVLGEHNFPTGHAKMRGNDQGLSWGYADRDVFQEGLKRVKESASPHIDIYLTLSTHEPFVVPEEKFEALFDKMLDTSRWSDPRKEIYKANRNIFSTLLYTDDAIRDLIKGYSQHPDFDRTIFIITGDHRLIPIPSDNRIARYHVPLILYSPMLKEAASFSSLAVHSSVTPTLLSWLTRHYGMRFPAQMPFISGALRTDQSFSSDLDIALARYKNGILDYVEGEYFLSDERLFRIRSGMKLEPVNDSRIKKRLTEKLADFNARGIFACENDRIAPAPRSGYLLFSLDDQELKYIRERALDSLPADEQFARARAMVFGNQYRESRTVLRNLLNNHPSYYDGYILLARTYAWDGQYDTARIYLQQVKKRAPSYGDVYVAMTDVEYWDGKHDKALEAVQEGLKTDSGNYELQARYARALWMTGKESEARAVAEDVLRKSPGQEIAKDLLDKMQ